MDSDHQPTSEPTRQASAEVVRANPNVDAKRLREAERVMRELRHHGMEPPKPMVRSPYGERFLLRADEVDEH